MLDLPGVRGLEMRRCRQPANHPEGGKRISSKPFPVADRAKQLGLPFVEQRPFHGWLGARPERGLWTDTERPELAIPNDASPLPR